MNQVGLIPKKQVMVTLCRILNIISEVKCKLEPLAAILLDEKKANEREKDQLKYLLSNSTF